MLEQVLEVFKDEYETKGEGLILDTYKPAEGTYLIVQKNNDEFKILPEIEIKYPKDKSEDIDRTIENLDFICMADYYSCLVDMNKPMDKSKIIHSNNYYSFFVKKPSLISEDGKKPPKLTEEIIISYYEVLNNPRIKYQKNKKSLQLYENVEKEYGEPNLEQIEEIHNWIKENIENLSTKYQGKNYLKIFFRYGDDKDSWLEDYRREGDRYLIPNIYNSNDYNVTIEDKTYGLPNYNMGLNAKKTFLENKTRKEKVLYLLDIENALLQKKLFDYLFNMASWGKYNVYIDNEFTALTNGESLVDKDKDDFSGLYIRLKKGKEVEIQDFDIIPLLKSELEKPCYSKNVLGANLELIKTKIGKITNLKELEATINEVFFYKMLMNNYYTEANDLSIKDGNLARNLILARDKINNWFRKGNAQGVWNVLNRVSSSLIEGAILKDYGKKAISQFNFRMSLKEYFEGGEDMELSFNEVRESLFKKINSKDIMNIESDKEYLYAVGQLVNYFISKSKGKNKPLSLAAPIIKSKNDEIIKKKLKSFYDKYNYDIDSFKDVRFKRLYSMVLEYENVSEINQDWILAGYLRNNMIFTKSESEEN